MCRHLLMVIASHINASTGEIPDRNQPSLTRLARFTGWSRSTVCRRLADLEQGGWLTRRRPPVWASQRQHVRTRYTVTIPGEPPPAAADPEPRNPAVDDGQLAAVVVDALAERGKRITPDDAARLLPELLAGCRVRTSAAKYLRTMIASEPSPGRWLPTPAPPRFTATGGFQ